MMMRTSERWAIAAVIAMTAPAVLALPALAAWRVSIAWGGMETFNKLVFCGSAASLCALAPLIFRRHLDLFWTGLTEEFTLFEALLIVVPASAAIWSVMPRWESWSGLGFYLYVRFLETIKERRNGFYTPPAPTTQRSIARRRERDEEPLTLKSVLRRVARPLWRQRRARVLADHIDAQTGRRDRRSR